MQQNLRRIILGVVVGSVVVLIVLALTSEAPEEQPPSARFDPVTRSCVGGDATSRQECESQLESVQAALRNASIAQESFRSPGTGYTERVEDLMVEGFVLPAGVSLSVAEVRPDGYCLEATDESGAMRFHLDSDDDTALPGACPLRQ